MKLYHRRVSRRIQPELTRRDRLVELTPLQLTDLLLREAEAGKQVVILIETTGEGYADRIREEYVLLEEETDA